MKGKNNMKKSKKKVTPKKKAKKKMLKKKAVTKKKKVVKRNKPVKMGAPENKMREPVLPVAEVKQEFISENESDIDAQTSFEETTETI